MQDPFKSTFMGNERILNIISNGEKSEKIKVDLEVQVFEEKISHRVD